MVLCLSVWFYSFSWWVVVGCRFVLSDLWVLVSFVWWFCSFYWRIAWWVFNLGTSQRANSKAYLNISQEELHAIKTKVVSTSSFEVLEEFLKNNQNINRRVDGRLVYIP